MQKYLLTCRSLAEKAVRHHVILVYLPSYMYSNGKLTVSFTPSPSMIVIAVATSLLLRLSLSSRLLPRSLASYDARFYVGDECHGPCVVNCSVEFFWDSPGLCLHGEPSFCAMWKSGAFVIKTNDKVGYASEGHMKGFWYGASRACVAPEAGCVEERHGYVERAVKTTRSQLDGPHILISLSLFIFVMSTSLHVQVEGPQGQLMDKGPQYYHKKHSTVAADCGHRPRTAGIEALWRPGTFFKGQWRSLENDGHGQWRVPLTSSSHARQLLHGKRILFHGDSVVRQIFMRLIWHLRGFGSIYEHYFHQDAFYMANETHDYFGIQPFSEHDPYVHNSTFLAFFIWEPFGEKIFFRKPSDPPLPSYLTQGIDVRIGGVGYHFSDFGHVSWAVQPDAPFSSLFANISDYINCTNCSKYGSWYVPMPLLPVELIAKGHAMMINDWLEYLEEWLRVNNYFYLPYRQMADSGVFARNSRDGHFQVNVQWSGSVEIFMRLTISPFYLLCFVSVLS